jgi:anti-sigma factor RsiW
MKPELLEPLLLDRALGELSPPVAALLDAHLARDPAAARRAAEFDATLQLARSAVAVPPEQPQPLDLERLRRAQPAPRRPSQRTEILRLAACLALGLAGGWLFRNANSTPIATAPVVVALAPTRPTDPATRFWSITRFAPEAAKLPSQKN